MAELRYAESAGENSGSKFTVRLPLMVSAEQHLDVPISTPAVAEAPRDRQLSLIGLARADG